VGRRLVYGPVASRRLGRSLGVDLMPFKTCSYDCIYCQLGRTTRKTVDRAEYVPVDEIVAQLGSALEHASGVQYLTLAGSGEPTLHSGLGEVIRAAKRLSSVPVAVLTNGSLLWRDDVRRELLDADLVLPSLDAGDAQAFAWVNRPHSQVRFDRMVEGLARFRRDFQGPIWLEVFLLAGTTSTTAAARQIAQIARGLGPERIQLNTASRPTTEEHAYRVPAERMLELAGLFGPSAEVISDREAASAAAQATSDEEILALLARRPSTVEGIARGLGVAAGEVLKRLDRLCDERLLTFSREGAQVFYRIVRGA
jgi:wyosine [tRNA(Phe)-imidazoG37] synthetase (radical SAM superfamily)